MQTPNGAAANDTRDDGTAHGLADASSRRGDAGDRATRPSTRRRDRGAEGSHFDGLRRRLYGMTDLSEYGWRDRLLIHAADLFFYGLIRVIGATMRWEAHGTERCDAIYQSGRRIIYAFWHVCIFGAAWFWRGQGIVVMSSVSRDAEYTGRFIKRFGYGTARGSATRGGSRAMAEMAECLLNGVDVAFTIDGPRGPAYQAKPGAVTLARHTGQAILPFHIAVARYWELPSWDRLQIPKPFTRAAVFIGAPITVARQADKDEIETHQANLQTSLDRLRDEGEAWRARLTSS